MSDPLDSRYEVRTRPAVSSSRRNDRLFSRHTYSSGGSVNMKNVPHAPKNQRVTVEGDEPTRSSGLNSLFAPTSSLEPYENQMKENNKVSNEDMESTTKRGRDGRLQVEVEGINDIPSKPEYTYEDSMKAAKVAKKRDIKVIKPISYKSVKDVSDALKDGKILVLCLKHTSSDISGRILDFAFGAASMCGAQVSVEAEKTYVFTIDKPLSQEERYECVNLGVALKK